MPAGTTRDRVNNLLSQNQGMNFFFTVAARQTTP